MLIIRGGLRTGPVQTYQSLMQDSPGADVAARTLGIVTSSLGLCRGRSALNLVLGGSPRQEWGRRLQPAWASSDARAAESWGSQRLLVSVLEGQGEGRAG